jgi:hypothetical protein
MIGCRLENDLLRGLVLVVMWSSYSALSILLIIALLTDWPGFLHGELNPLGH